MEETEDQIKFVDVIALNVSTVFSANQKFKPNPHCAQNPSVKSVFLVYIEPKFGAHGMSTHWVQTLVGQNTQKIRSYGYDFAPGV